MGEENHNLCFIFFQILPNPPSFFIDLTYYLTILITKIVKKLKQLREGNISSQKWEQDLKGIRSKVSGRDEYCRTHG